jgi:hypothetical protein
VEAIGHCIDLYNGRERPDRNNLYSFVGNFDLRFLYRTNSEYNVSFQQTTKTIYILGTMKMKTERLTP